MPSKYQYYRDMMEQETPRLTEYSGKWTSFLDTAGRMYKYRFEDQVMIFLQKPDAQACAEYGIWNEVMHRYVLRGSKGIASPSPKPESPEATEDSATLVRNWILTKSTMASSSCSMPKACWISRA